MFDLDVAMLSAAPYDLGSSIPGRVKTPSQSRLFSKDTPNESALILRRLMNAEF